MPGLVLHSPSPRLFGQSSMLYEYLLCELKLGTRCLLLKCTAQVWDNIIAKALKIRNLSDKLISAEKNCFVPVLSTYNVPIYYLCAFYNISPQFIKQFKNTKYSLKESTGRKFIYYRFFIMHSSA